MVYTFGLWELPNFAVENWHQVQNNPAMTGQDSLTLNVGPITIDIVMSPGSRRDRGRFDVFTKIDYRPDAPSLSIMTGTGYADIPGGSIPFLYPDGKYFFDLNNAIADVQNWLSVIGTISNDGQPWHKEHPIHFPSPDEDGDDGNEMVELLGNRLHDMGYRPYYVNGPAVDEVNEARERINMMTFLLKTGDCDVMLYRTLMKPRNAMYGNINNRSHRWGVNVMQPVGSIQFKQIDCMDGFPREYFSLATAASETQLWLDKFWS